MASHDLTGRVALVTGAGTGIGRASALALAAAGAAVAIHYHRSKAGAAETLHLLESAGGRGCLVPGDLMMESEAEAVVDETVANLGRLDILFNNAGSPLHAVNLADCSTHLWRQILDVNLTSAFVVTRRAIPHLRESGHAAIINNLTLSVQTGSSGGAGVYAVAKGGLQVLTRALARELAPAVRVNAIMPGVIDTPHHEMFSTPEKMADYRRQTPLGRNGTAEEVAEVVRFLASDAARFMTGALVDVNGGRFLR